MSTGDVIDARATFLCRALTNAGLPPGEAAYLVGAVALQPTTATKLACMRDGLRPHGAERYARRWLEVFDMLGSERESCAHCGKDVHARMALVIVKSVAYCSPCCALDALGVPA